MSSSSSPTPTPQLEALAEALAQAQHVVILTGAGVSAESGIPTFRDALESYWSRYDPQELATPEAFERDPELVTRWYDERRCAVLECDPNPAHQALADIERALGPRGRGFVLLTQNVDQLHQRAGSEDVVELHGSLARWRCTRTGQSFLDLPVPFETYPPPSPEGGLLRPGVVWFGEALPAEALERASQAASSCDLYIAIGTSGLVWPAAGFVEHARRAGATTAELNLEDTPLSSEFDLTPRGRAGELLPRLLELAFDS